MGFLKWLRSKESTCNVGAKETQVQSLGWEDTPEVGMANHSSIHTWKIPWTEEPGGLQSHGLYMYMHMSQRIGHD